MSASDLGLRGPGSWVALVATALLVQGACPGRAAASPADSLRLNLEVGGGTDISNEFFYEDAFVDTTFLGRRLVGSPEIRWAGIARVALDGTRAEGRTRFRVQNDASVGDLLQQDALSATAQGALGPSVAWWLAPRFEFRRDRTFGRDLTQRRGELVSRLRRSFDDAATALELGLRGDLLSSTGVGASIVPDRASARASVAFEHAPLFGPEWRFAYALVARAFPDSSTRDHLEHGADVRVRLETLTGHSLALEAEGVRRVTRRPVPTSRDDLLEGRARAEAVVRMAAMWSAVTEIEIEAMRYDTPDSALYFDYSVARARVAGRLELAGWSIAAGPRGEVLVSRFAPAEEYREIAGFAELETFAGSAWWSVGPACGWRSYDAVAVPEMLGLHSSYRFAEATVLGDQSLGRGLRVRATGTVRLEWHLDHAQDARGLYFSLEVRKLL